jgi:electron transport complex protein RnfG
MSVNNVKAMWRSGITLGFFALVGVVLLIGAQWLTKDQIAENDRQMRLQRLNEIVSAAEYDNDLLSTAQQLDVGIKGLANTIKAFTAKQGAKSVARIYEVTSLQGYSGPISLLIGVDALDNSLRGVRVISHKETPGLGDKIETNKADWILQFSGKSLSDPDESQWKVRKDGGAFDQFTGATITPRAVVNAVRETLKLATSQPLEQAHE